MERREGYNYNWIVDELTKQEKVLAVSVNMLLDQDEPQKMEASKTTCKRMSNCVVPEMQE